MYISIIPFIYCLQILLFSFFSEVTQRFKRWICYMPVIMPIWVLGKWTVKFNKVAGMMQPLQNQCSAWAFPLNFSLNFYWRSSMFYIIFLNISDVNMIIWGWRKKVRMIVINVYKWGITAYNVQCVTLIICMISDVMLEHRDDDADDNLYWCEEENIWKSLTDIAEGLILSPFTFYHIFLTVHLIYQ